MLACTFFGSRDCTDAVKRPLYHMIEFLIVGCGVERFYVGNQGHFDAYARGILRELKEKHPHIQYAVVLPCLPVHGTEGEDYCDTMFPEELENVPPRFAIDRRNRWLVEHSQFVVCYAPKSWGGAAKFVRLARKKMKVVLDITDTVEYESSGGVSRSLLDIAAGVGFAPKDPI